MFEKKATHTVSGQKDVGVARSIECNCLRYLLWCAVIVGAANNMQSTFAEIHPDADELLQKIIAAQTTDRQLLSAMANGVLEYESATAQATWDVTFHLNEKKMLIENVLRPEGAKLGPVQNYSVSRTLADGELIVTGLFSERIHPDGCTAECYDDDHNGFMMGTLGVGFDLRKYMIPLLLRSEKVLEGYRGDMANVTRDPDGAADTLFIRYKSDAYWRIQTSPAIEHRIIKAEMGANAKIPAPQLTLEYDWIREDGQYRPRQIVVRQYRPGLKGYTQNRLTIEDLTSGLQPSDFNFSLKSLLLFGRCILQDRRSRATVPVRNVRFNDLPTEENLTLRDMIEKLSPRN